MTADDRKSKTAADAPPPSRRDILRGFAVGAGGIASLPLLAAPALAQSFPSEYEVRQRYQKNEWIERYYALNRL